MGMHQDFKMHSVYREIVAISQVLHKNVVRYHACWIECVQPRDALIAKVVKRVEMNNRHQFKNLQAQAKEFEKKTKKKLM